MEHLEIQYPSYRQQVSWKWFDRFRLFEGSPDWWFHLPLFELHNDIAWHSTFNTFYAHTYRYRMQKALSNSNLKQIQKIIRQFREKGLKYDLDQVIDTKYNLNALHIAASTNQFPVIQYLIFKGAKVDIKDPLGNTALAYAAMNDCLEATHTLIKNGAKLDVKDKYGYTILQKARNRLCKVVPFLEQQIKNPKIAQKSLSIQVNPKLKKLFKHPWIQFVKNRKIFTGKALLYPFNNLKGDYKVIFSNYDSFGVLYDNNKKK